MKKTKIIHALEYFSFTLVLSYFFIHNIFLVMIGIIFSLYLININFINRIIKSINNNFFNKKVDIELNINDKRIETNPINLKSTQADPKLTLVETIEELGFIPSLEKNNNNNIG